MGESISKHGWKGVGKDLIAGLTVAAVAVPQAMAYALIAGVDPRIGLYTAIVMTALGSILGSSSHLINGPTNAISLVVFSALAVSGLHAGPEAGEEARAAALNAVFFLAILVGAVQIVIALLKLGDLTRYISESVMLGFMAGAGFLVALTQVHNLLGLKSQGNGDEHLLVRTWHTIFSGEAISWRALGLGTGTALLVIGLRRIERRLKAPLPDMLLALIAAAALVAALGWHVPGPDGRPAIAVIGAVPRGLPAFLVPDFQSALARKMAGSALAIALLGLLEALAIAKSIASRTREPIDYNRQCLAEGLANLGGGFFQCMPGSGSLTRSAINYQAGAVSRLSGIFAALAVGLTVLLFAPLANFVPIPALAGILLVTAWRLVDKPRLMYALRATRYDAGLLLATAGAAIFISIEFSILIGTFLSFLLFIPRAARLSASELVVSSERVVRDRQPDDPRCGRMVLFDFEGEMFFGAAPELEGYFDDLRKRTDEGVRIVILRVKRARNPDMVCLERLHQFLDDMHARKVTVLMCGVREDFAKGLSNLGFHNWLPASCIFLEDTASGSSTLKAVRYAYELLDRDVCSTCPKRGQGEPEKGDLYYMI